MGSISKHCLNSSTSNEETHHHHHHRPEKFKGENHGGVGRFYECNFCKRGFTNAQALGGHMNIHRKDKDRASKSNNNKMKKKTWKNSKFSISKYGGDDDDEEECKNCSSVHIRYKDHQIMDCFQFINYSSKLGFDYYSNQSNDSTANLSIQIDQHYSNIQEDTYEGRENELDLELRLG